jgi:pilus assembly protein CpaC
MKHNSVFTSLLLSTGILLSAPAAMAATPLSISINESRYVQEAGLSRVVIGNPEIADVQLLSAREFLLIGKKSGSTSLLVWGANGRQEYLVTVTGDNSGLAAMIEKAINLPGVTVQMVGDKILLRGTVMNQYEKDLALKIAGLYTGTTPETSASGSGSPGKAIDKTGGNVIDLLQMARPSQIRLEAQVIEISSSNKHELGIQYGTKSSGDSDSKIDAEGTIYAGEDWNTRGWGGWLVRHSSTINAALNALITKGKARILSRPNISTLSGEKAKILIGGSIPVPVNNDGRVSIEWKEYGVKLDIEPVADQMDKITSKVHAEISRLDYANGLVQNGFSIPALATREAEAVIHVSNGMSMVIGGLLNSEDGKTVSKIPLLGNIPILGEFFKHTSRTRDKRELIIIITPHLIAEDTQWPMSDQMKEAFNEGQTEYGSMNKVNVNTTEPEVEKAIARNIEKRAADKAKKEQKEAEKEAKRAAKEIAKQRKKAEENGYAKERSALRERINSILRNDAANNNSSSYRPAPEQNVTVVLPSKEEIVVEQPVLAEEPVIMEQPAANSGEEAALGDYLNR